MKLLTELTQDVGSIIQEDTETKRKSYFIEGPFLAAGVKNKNGRIYNKSILENALKEYQPWIKEKRSLGELGHPQSPAVIQERASHLITDLHFEGNHVIGRAKILNTPMGKIVKEFLDEGVKLGVSSRGLGSLKQNNEGIMEVQDDFRIATVDIVSDPSGPGCFVNGIMEGVEFWYEPDGSLRSKNIKEIAAETVKKAVKKLPRGGFNEEIALRLFKNYCTLLINK